MGIHPPTTQVDDITFHGADGDVVDGLVVAMDMLIDHCGKKKYQKRVFLVTEGGNEVDDDGLDRILDRFKVRTPPQRWRKRMNGSRAGARSRALILI